MGSHDVRATLAVGNSAAGKRRGARGFTLIELLIVVTILGIFLTIGMPALSEFVADQRVKTVTSNIVADIAFARAKAIETGRRINMEQRQLGTGWNNGWRIFADNKLDGSVTFNNAIDTELKVFEGFAAGNVSFCTKVPEFATRIIFRPDGRIVRTSAAASDDGIWVIDLMKDANPANDKVRQIVFGLAGRTTVLKKNGVAPPCP